MRGRSLLVRATLPSSASERQALSPSGGNWGKSMRKAWILVGTAFLLTTITGTAEGAAKAPAKTCVKHGKTKVCTVVKRGRTGKTGKTGKTGATGPKGEQGGPG